MKRGLLSALAIIAAVSMTVWIRDRAPHPEDWQGSFLDDAAVGEPVALRYFTVTVTGIEGGRGLVIGTNEPRPTGGVWLVVMLSVSTDRAPALIETIELVDDRGRTYVPAGRFNQPVTETPVQPGMVARGGVAFEVPFDVGDRVHVRTGPDRTALDAMSNIAVPIPTDQWAVWSAEGSTVELPRRTVEAA